MSHSTSSFTTFRKIIANTLLTQPTQPLLDPLTRGELFLESKIEEEEPLQLGLQSENSKFMDQVVRSSIDSQTKKKKQSSTSIPLSQLIFRDTGFDYLFDVKSQSLKLQRKSLQNIKIIKLQTEEMINLINMEILSIQEQQIKKKIIDIERQINQLRAKRKSKSPIQQHSDYLCSMGRKRKERFSGRLLQLGSKQNRSHLKTQCDSKPPSLPSAPITPVSQQKIFISPNKSPNHHLYILKSKRDAIKDSILTLETYFFQRCNQAKQQNSAIRQQIQWLDSQGFSTPFKRPNFRIEGFNNERCNTSSKSLSRRMMAICSPRSTRQGKKGQLIRLISGAQKDLRLSPRQQYFLSRR